MIIQGEDKNLKVEVINEDIKLDEITEEVHGDGLEETSQKTDTWGMPRYNYSVDEKKTLKENLRKCCLCDKRYIFIFSWKSNKNEQTNKQKQKCVSKRRAIWPTGIFNLALSVQVIVQVR